MTRDDLSSFITNKLGTADATSVTRCNEFIQRRFQLIWDIEFWRDTLKLITGQSVTTTGVMNFPSGIDRIIAIRSTGDHILDPVDSPFLMKYDPTIFERTGDPLAFEEYSDSADSYTRKIRVWPLPSETKAIIMVGKMTCPTLAGSDSPNTYLRSVDNCLIAYAQGDLLQRMRQFGKANALYDEAATHLQSMRNLENQQSARQWIILPDVEPTDFSTDDWLVAKY